ncbi:DNA cytosine methyltransferase [Rahnella sp. Lac-M11]|uniref:DNA (cytosine-5-)-methyltransferase n=1 Tax=Rahnella contaminans TaxID=2703882 RepID=A0A6M2B3R8_9GAMM|nr:DNA (cytosine-5-)-methyltransferase [Rahnella contaminans]NGX87412.1 DNA cytosine methyltransferase [Rahnella contaminans]
MKEISIPIVDLFAGPGGLGEGFSACEDNRAFRIVVSAEKDSEARKTLLLRAFYRILKRENVEGLQDYYNFCNGNSEKPYTKGTLEQWGKANAEARQITLGSDEGNAELDQIIEEKIDTAAPWVLIGGPPCQAYSLVGRARNKGNVEYKAENDNRHFLYKEYLRIIQQYYPYVFVMENVKGILSSRVNGKRVFDDILVDLTDPDAALNRVGKGFKYRICSLVSEQVFKAGDDPTSIDPNKFIIRSENHSIPQARHRVILVGIREDVPGTLGTLLSDEKISVEDVISDLPQLRSKLSKGEDSAERWKNIVKNQLCSLARITTDKKLSNELTNAAYEIIHDASIGALRVPRYISQHKSIAKKSNLVNEWFHDARLNVWLNHETRGHMDSDLGRYGYAAVFAKINNRSPKGHKEFDIQGLKPEHKNWESGKFSDRFRVQLKEHPSTTITSHISKDGHYFIHYDAKQCRSLTVREAARLQTFPDNYFFQGNRTQQFHQVGNAVPPYLAYQIAKVLFNFFDNIKK